MSESISGDVDEPGMERMPRKCYRIERGAMLHTSVSTIPKVLIRWANTHFVDGCYANVGLS